MFTPEQETFLKKIADLGIAEEADIAERNARIEADAAVAEARAKKLVELQTKAQELIDTGLQEFEASVSSALS